MLTGVVATILYAHTMPSTGWVDTGDFRMTVDLVADKVLQDVMRQQNAQCAGQSAYVTL